MVLEEKSVMTAVGEELMEAADKELKELNRILCQVREARAGEKQGKK